MNPFQNNPLNLGKSACKTFLANGAQDLLEGKEIGGGGFS